MKLKVIVSLLLVGLVAIGSFIIFQYQIKQKQQLRQLVSQEIVKGLNHRVQPEADKLGVTYLAVNEYPKIVIKMKIHKFFGDRIEGSTKQQLCEHVRTFETVKDQAKRQRIYNLLQEDQVMYQVEIFNHFDKEIENRSQILSECSNFPKSSSWF